ncbi:putative glyoxal reductase, partial [Cooperia oncophora]
YEKRTFHVEHKSSGNSGQSINPSLRSPVSLQVFLEIIRRHYSAVPSSAKMSNSPNILGGRMRLNDGNEMPMIGLGISRINGQQSISNSVRTALEAGYRLFDTAQLYGNIEEYLPKYGLQREDVFITTKVQTKDGDATMWAEESVLGSLKKLRTKYIDLALLHFPRDRFTGSDDAYEVNKKGRKEVWRKLEQLKERGLIKSIGVSNYEVYHLVELLDYAKHLPAVNQIEYHPYFTRQTLVNFCRQNRIFVQAFSSLLWGNQEILKEPIVKQLVEKYAVTPQTILYAFALCSGMGIIPKSETPERIRDNLNKVKL